MDDDRVSIGERLLGRKEAVDSGELRSTGGRKSGSSWLGDGWWGSVAGELRRQGAIALPMVFVNMFQFLLQVISLMMLGMASALETLCGQAFGAEQYQKLGLYTQKAIVSLFLVCIPITLLWFYMEKLLILIGQDPKISYEAGKYAVCLIPGLFASALLQPMVKFLQSQSLVLPLLGASIVTLCFHIPVCWLLVFKSSVGHVGAAIAVSLSYWVNVAALSLYIKFAPSCKKTYTPFSMEALAGICDFLGLAVPSAVMICLEYWSFELLILLSGLLPNPELEASVLSICLYSLYLVYSIPFGLAAAASTRVSNELGAGCPRTAQLAVFVVILLAVIDISIVSTTIYGIRYLLGYAYSSDKEVIQYVAKMAPLVSLSTCMDAIQGVLSGVARGCGWQDLGAYVNLGSFYLLGIPVAYVLGFHFHFGGIGLWIGILCGSTVQAILLSLITGFTNWQRQADKARDRVLDKPIPFNDEAA
ncbi:protein DETOXIFICATION 12-like isoform X2 [Nymphaea colorata]|uniref:protein DETOXIFICATION 12-like isoform X2 n=1 Tax=Nymphaea colorata TaxID=210225 RepID=UPI00129E5634|nr:protein DETOXIFICATION 12-like isoform X2 [Nymphaea colorata]